MRRNYYTSTHIYSLVSVRNSIYLEFSQTGESCDRIHRFYVGDVGRNGFKSYQKFDYFSLSEVIGIKADLLLAKINRFANSVTPQTVMTEREKYCSRVGNRREKSKCDRIAKGIRIC